VVGLRAVGRLADASAGASLLVPRRLVTTRYGVCFHRVMCMRDRVARGKRSAPAGAAQSGAGVSLAKRLGFLRVAMHLVLRPPE